MKPLPQRLQSPLAERLPSTRQQAYAEALKAAELEFRTAQTAGDPARYARALAEYDKLQAMFPFVAAGAGDEQV